MIDENRKIAKWICNMIYSCLVLKNICGLKKENKEYKKVSKKVLKKFGNWSYHQLEQFIIERVEKVGKTFLFVNPVYTSHKYSQCHQIAKNNRFSQSEFYCRVCFFRLSTDLNAARNLSTFGKSELGRASVNSPNVAVLPLAIAISSLSCDSVPTASPCIHSGVINKSLLRGF